MKLHIGTDLRGLVHTVRATHAGAADVSLPCPFPAGIARVRTRLEVFSMLGNGLDRSVRVSAC
jgi:hypothetical protein